MSLFPYKLPPKGAFSAAYTSSPLTKPQQSKTPKKTRQNSKAPDTQEYEEAIATMDFNDMFQYAQLAIQKSCEVQEDIAKLFTLWDMHEKEDMGEMWKFLNKILQENGFKTLGDKPNLKKVTKIVIDLICEINGLRQAVSLISPKKRAEFEFKENNEEILTKAEYEEKIRCYQDYIKSLEDQISLIKGKVNEFQDMVLAQSQHDHDLIKEIQESVEAENEDEILNKIISYKRIMSIVPTLEIFVEEICKEIVPDLIEDSNYKSYSKALKEVFPKIKSLRSSLGVLENFKSEVYKAAKLPSTSAEAEVYYKISAIGYFQKLFKVEESEDLPKAMESLFLYYGNTKTILEHLRGCLKIPSTTPLHILFEEIKRKIN